MARKSKPGRLDLLGGPYHPPALRIGQRATCYYRDCSVVITGWHDARISWPMCRPLQPTKGPSGLLVEEELARAIRTESSKALQHWWGVGEGLVSRWRWSLGIGRMDSPGTRRLVEQALAASMQARGVEGRVWEDEEAALVGQISDVEVARRTGRRLRDVHRKRRSLHLRDPGAQPTRPSLPWTPEQDALVLSLPTQEAVRRTGHPVMSVERRRAKLLTQRDGSPPGQAKGERHGSAGLTADQVQEIRRRVEEGERQADLARAFGVSPAAVSLIVNRKIWGHLSSKEHAQEQAQEQAQDRPT